MQMAQPASYVYTCLTYIEARLTPVQVEFQVLDARKMNCFEEDSFDLVIDKGTLDAMLCGKSGFKDVGRMIHEICRVLRSPGSYVVISHMEFTSEEMQSLLHDVLMPAFDSNRTLQWRLAVLEVEHEDVATVYVFSSQPKRFTRQMLTQPMTLPTKVSTFDGI